MIEVKDLNKTYDRRRRNANRVLRDVSVTLPDRGLVCILGPSGCGKTSLLNAMGGLDVFDSGTLIIGDKPMSHSGSRAFEAERNRNFGYIFQNYYLLDDHSVAYNVYLGLHSLKLSHAKKVRRVRQALKAVDMDRYIRRRVGELSGGQQQRVAIARALARRPRVIFADEPTGNLDERNTRNICSLLRQASKESLVIMVTHEERIARFFADRIITLNNGVIASDSEEWHRGSLNAETDDTIYTGDLESSEASDGNVTLKLLTEPGASPVGLTVVALRDRIVLKLSDPRAVSLSTNDESPRIVEGERPNLTLDVLENTENEAQRALFADEEAQEAKAGSGITVPMMFRNASQLNHEKSIRRAGMKVFLCLLTVVTLLTAGDFIALSKIDPEDFVTTDSHLLMITIEQGKELNPDYVSSTNLTLSSRVKDFIHTLAESGLDFDFVPDTNVIARYTATVFPQLGSESMRLPRSFSYVPLDRFDESTLIYGRMPESSQEVVMDRQVIEAMLADGDGIVQNSIVGLEYFLGVRLELESRNYSLTVVGISDSKDRSVYASRTALLTIRGGGIRVLGLSEFKKMMSGSEVDYSDVTLGDDECIVNYTTAGSGYQHLIGNYYSIGNVKRYLITDVAGIEGSDALAVVSDSQLDELMVEGFNTRQLYLYCTDKTAMRSFINKAVRSDGTISVRIVDPYQDQYDEYLKAAAIRTDARSIVTATVLAVCLIMLYLLCRTQARERIKLLAVYRLLGIPNRKLHVIFLFEGVISALTAIVPSALITWAAVVFIKTRTEIELSIILSRQAVTITVLGILIYYLFMSVLPLFKLLRLPPAQLAAKYDM